MRPGKDPKDYLITCSTSLMSFNQMQKKKKKKKNTISHILVSLQFFLQSTKFTIHPVWEDNGLDLKENEPVSFCLN